MQKKLLDWRGVLIEAIDAEVPKGELKQLARAMGPPDNVDYLKSLPHVHNIVRTERDEQR